MLDASGNVGIGTASPAAKLEVAGNVAVRKGDRLILDSNDATVDSYVTYDAATGRIEEYLDGVLAVRVVKK